MPTRRGLLLPLACGLLLPHAARGGSIAGLLADRVEVRKRERVMELWNGELLLHRFRVALGRRPEGHKLQEGDGRTPEGRYELTEFLPKSYFYRAIRISYPNEGDRLRARQRGVRPGGDILVHGLDPAIARRFREDHWLFNWTRGCIAVTDAEMDVIWASVTPGTPIEIKP